MPLAMIVEVAPMKGQDISPTDQDGWANLRLEPIGQVLDGLFLLFVRDQAVLLRHAFHPVVQGP